MSNLNPNKETRFKQAGSQKLSSRTIALRLVESIETELRSTHGDNLSAWIRSAIAEKLEREQSA